LSSVYVEYAREGLVVRCLCMCLCVSCMSLALIDDSIWQWTCRMHCGWLACVDMCVCIPPTLYTTGAGFRPHLFVRSAVAPCRAKLRLSIPQTSAAAQCATARCNRSAPRQCLASVTAQHETHCHAGAAGQHSGPKCSNALQVAAFVNPLVATSRRLSEIPGGPFTSPREHPGLGGASFAQVSRKFARRRGTTDLRVVGKRGAHRVRASLAQVLPQVTNFGKMRAQEITNTAKWCLAPLGSTRHSIV
jgi:hypothetical protein